MNTLEKYEDSIVIAYLTDALKVMDKNSTGYILVHDALAILKKRKKR